MLAVFVLSSNPLLIGATFPTLGHGVGKQRRGKGSNPLLIGATFPTGSPGACSLHSGTWQQSPTNRGDLSDRLLWNPHIWRLWSPTRPLPPPHLLVRPSPSPYTPKTCHFPRFVEPPASSGHPSSATSGHASRAPNHTHSIRPSPQSVKTPTAHLPSDIWNLGFGHLSFWPAGPIPYSSGRVFGLPFHMWA